MRFSPACMDETILQQFASEQLPAEQALAVEQHIRECPRCAALLEKQFASLISILRTAARTETHAEQKRIDQLIQQLEELPARVGGEVLPSDSVAEESPEVSPTVDPLRTGIVLSPPCQPDELGRLGPYRVLELVGVGGMGTVFRAEDPVLKRVVAIKVIRRGVGVENVRQRFLHEGQAIAALDHDHIVPIWQMGEDNGQPYMVMPLLRGETLSSLLRRQAPLPLHLTLQIARETASGLAAAHAAGLIHRDLKPDNLWLESRGEGFRVRILDFGLVTRLPEEHQPLQCEAVLGTPQYMAPEQAWGGPVDPRTDLFGLGCVLYECLAGRRPFAGRTQLAVLWALANHQLRPLHEVEPKIPQAISDLVMRLLARHPQDRPGSASEVVRAVQALETSLCPAATAKVSDVKPGSWRTRLRLLLLLGVTLVILAALLILLLSVLTGL